MITLDSTAPLWAHAVIRQIDQWLQSIRPDNAVKISGGTIDGTAIGGTTPAAINATTLQATGFTTLAGGASLVTTTAVLTNGAAAAVGTLNNAPSAGNPTKWIAINDGGVTRQIPCW